jgi:hypothetical protein
MTSFIAESFDLGAPQLVVGNFFCARASKKFCAICALGSDHSDHESEAEMLIIHQIAIPDPWTAHACCRELPERCTLRDVEASVAG